MQLLRLIKLWVLLASTFAGSSDAACSDFNPCVEELGQGQRFRNPSQCTISNKDEIEITVDIQELKFGWLKFKRRVYNGDPTGPTWKVNKGERVKVTVKNLLSDLNNEQPGKEENDMNRPNTTNIHTHGLHISSVAPQDSVLIKILPGEEYTYKYCLHEKQPSGTYWYHAHVHGSTLLQVNSGMAGLIIVHDNSNNTARQLWDVSCPDNCDTDIQMIIQGLLMFNGGLGSFAQVQDNVGDNPYFKQDWILTGGGISLREWLETNVGFMTVNGLLEPVLELDQGKMYRFRMVNAAGYDVVEPLITNKGTNDSADGCTVREIAHDGIYLNKPRELHQGQSVLIPGNRVDWLVVCDTAGQYELRSYADQKNRKSFGDIRRWSGLLVSLNVVSRKNYYDGHRRYDRHWGGHRGGRWGYKDNWDHGGRWGYKDKWGSKDRGDGWGNDYNKCRNDRSTRWRYNDRGDNKNDWDHCDVSEDNDNDANDEDYYGDDYTGDYGRRGRDYYHYRQRRNQLVDEMVEEAKNKEQEMELKHFFGNFGWGQGGNHGSDQESVRFDFDLPTRPDFVSDLRNETEESIKERYVMEFDTLLQLGRESWSSADNYRYAMTVDTKQEWHVINTDPQLAHPFHPHVNSFQVISYNNYTGPFSISFEPCYVLYSMLDKSACDYQRAGLNGIDIQENIPDSITEFLGHNDRYAADAGDTAGYVKVGDWRDVLLVQPLSNITIRFVTERYTGPVIIHCHLLSHEDAGMMMITKIVKEPAEKGAIDYLLANITSGNAFPGTCRSCDRYPFNNPKTLCDLDGEGITNEVLHNNVRSESTATEGKKRRYYNLQGKGEK